MDVHGISKLSVKHCGSSSQFFEKPRPDPLTLASQNRRLDQSRHLGLVWLGLFGTAPLEAARYVADHAW
jgi:hypothetical protein